MYPILVEEFIADYTDFKPETVEQTYMATKCDMHKFKEICTDCRDKAKEMNYAFVDLNLAMEFISDLPAQ